MPRQLSLTKLFSDPIHFFAFGFGSGLSPYMPGTVGTAVAIPFYLLFSYLPVVYYSILLIVLFSLGVWLCTLSSQKLGVHDHSGIVWDEMVGYWITMLAIPLNWKWVIAGFILFRIFDIWKPWPIRWLDQKVHGGFGIMIDDVLAAVYAWIMLQVLLLTRHLY